MFGDFFGKEPLENLENLLIGVKYDKEEISRKLTGVKIADYFGNVSTSEFMDLLFSTDA
ncbi:MULTISPECIES: lipoate protein ligase C-terminal domain-containing protein [unclassified Polaribacter]|uniref:lipoate protein ligase C-terminal domain-containing protein n=1 Tax=unclassified Polaribacter TaxID=196858 RepID=UPI001CB9D7F0|nr:MULTISPECIES: lipoate protein ligase C-terminal domain-containing protein [unclassified Polaribacter]